MFLFGLCQFLMCNYFCKFFPEWGINIAMCLSTWGINGDKTMHVLFRILVLPHHDCFMRPCLLINCDCGDLITGINLRNNNIGTQLCCTILLGFNSVRKLPLTSEAVLGETICVPQLSLHDFCLGQFSGKGKWNLFSSDPT